MDHNSNGFLLRHSMRSFWVGLCCVVALAGVAVEPVHAVKLRAEAVLTTGLDMPIYGTTAPGMPGKIFILEQLSQAIKIYDQDTKQLSTFLNLPNAPTGGPPQSNGERGTKGLAFHPDFATNGKFYLHQNSRPDNVVNILEFTRSTTNPMVADPSSQRTILSFTTGAAGTNQDHSAGWIGFSPIDNYLYIPTGDGGSSGSNQGLPAQDLNDLRGKVLRIDVDGDDFPAELDRNYAIPADNPFAQGGALPEILTSGHRHPYSGSFDSETGDLYLGEVGSNRFEEVNLLEAGDTSHRNYGWRYYEGFLPHPAFAGDPIPVDPVDPIYVYSRNPQAAVIGGYVYRGDEIPELVGDYIYTDIRRRTFFTFDPEDPSDIVDRSEELSNPIPDTNYSGVSNFIQDSDGELFFVDLFGDALFAIVEDIAGDYDKDGDVDVADYEVWRQTFGETTDLRADGNGDDIVDAADYNIWRDNLGVPAEGNESQVPEPAAIWVVMAAIGILGASRRTERA